LVVVQLIPIVAPLHTVANPRMRMSVVYCGLIGASRVTHAKMMSTISNLSADDALHLVRKVVLEKMSFDHKVYFDICPRVVVCLHL
jgi:hypothetical protein